MTEMVTTASRQITWTTAEVLAEVERNGFAILREHVSGREVEALQAEAEWFLNNTRP